MVAEGCPREGAPPRICRCLVDDLDAQAAGVGLGDRWQPAGLPGGEAVGRPGGSGGVKDVVWGGWAGEGACRIAVWNRSVEGGGKQGAPLGEAFRCSFGLVHRLATEGPKADFRMDLDDVLLKIRRHPEVDLGHLGIDRVALP